MTYLYLLKKFWPVAVAVLMIGAGFAAAAWLDGVLEERDVLRAYNTSMAQTIKQYKANATTVDDLRSEIAVCAQSVLDLQQISDEWRDRYHHAERRNPRIIRVPVEVAAPGTPCDEAATQLAVWLASEVTP
jgi:hypothetical protein